MLGANECSIIVIIMAILSFISRDASPKYFAPRLVLGFRSVGSTIISTTVAYKMIGLDLGTGGWVTWESTDPAATPVITTPTLVGALGFRAILQDIA